MAEDPLPFFDELSPLPGQVCPFIPAQEELVELLFRNIEFDTSRDSVVDLGCGDGRILLCAAKTFKLPGIGIDINSDLLTKATAEAHSLGLQNLVSFHFLSFTDPAFSLDKLPGGRVPTIVAIYLIPEATHFFRTKLTDFLKEQAKAGLRVRVMSIAFKLYDWRPIAVGPQHNFYIYDHTSLPS